MPRYYSGDFTLYTEPADYDFRTGRDQIKVRVFHNRKPVGTCTVGQPPCRVQGSRSDDQESAKAALSFLDAGLSDDYDGEAYSRPSLLDEAGGYADFDDDGMTVSSRRRVGG